MDQTIQTLQDKIRAAAADRGIDPDVALRIANAESTLSNAAKNTRSSARGLFQIIDSTWKNFGGDPTKRNDVDENIRVGLNVIAGNRDSFLKRFGKEPTKDQLYSMHVLGTGDAFKVFNAKDDAAIKNIVPKKVIKSNPYMEKMSVADFLNFTQAKMAKKGTVAPTAVVAKTETAPVPMPQAPKETMQQSPSKMPSSRTVDLPTAANPTAPPINKDLLASLGPNYQAALAAMTLSDSSDDDDDEALAEKYADRFGDQGNEVTPSTLADVQLTYASPFEDTPVKMSEGGDPSIPFPTDMSFDDIPEMPPNPTPEQQAEFLRKVEEMDARAYWKRRGPNSADELNYSPSRKMMDELYSGMGTEIPDSRDNTGMPIPTDDQMEQRKRDRYYATGGEVGVQKMAFGGIPYKPSALIPSAVKNSVGQAQADLKAYNQQIDSYNAQLEDYKRRVDEYNNQINAYNDQLNQYKSSYVMTGENPTLFISSRGSYRPIGGGGSAISVYARDLNVIPYGNIPGLDKVPGYYIRQGEYRSISEPTAPRAPGNEPTAPVQPNVGAAQAALAAAKDKQRRLQLTYDVMEDPERFNLSMPALFAEGGEATYTVVPNSAAAEYEKYLQLMKGVKNQQDMSSAQRNQAMNIRSKIFDPITEETLQGIRPGGRSIYDSPMLPREITAQNSPTTLFAGIPGAKVLESTGLQDTTTRGFILDPASEGHMRTEDIIFLAPHFSKKANELLYKRIPERVVKGEDPELSQRVTLAHEAEHLLKRRAGVNINETFDDLTKQARDENYIGSLFKKPASALRKEFVNNATAVAPYLKDKFKLSLPGYFAAGAHPNDFHEQVASLAGLEETFGVDLTQDPVLRETLFSDPDVRRAFRAITGLRQTRLDAKDLAPHTLTPDAPYYPDASKIRTRTPTPVKRADGSPVYGEIPDSGPITADTRAAMSNFQVPNAREALDVLKKIYGEGVSNAESLVRGSIAAIPGTVGDIGQSFDIRGLRNLPTTEQLLKKYPQRMTQPTAETAGYEDVGQYIPPPIPPAAVSGTAKTLMDVFKKSAPAGPTTDQRLRALFGGTDYVTPTGNVVQAVPQVATPAARSADQLFVGRVDEFLANQKNPVTKEQLIGQLKGKFRDYEIARVEQALADLPATSKLQPADLLARVKNKYPVENFRTSIIEPKSGVVYSNVDNVYGGDIGVINLSLPVADVARKTSDEAMLTLNSLNNFGNGKFNPSQIAQITNYLKEKGLSSNYKELLNSFKAVENSSEMKKLTAAKETLIDVGRTIMYPFTHPKEAEIFARLKKQYPRKSVSELLPLRDMEMFKIGLKELTELTSDPKFKPLQYLTSALKREIDAGQLGRTSDIIGKINVETSLLDQQFKSVIDTLVPKAARDEYTKLGKELKNKRIYEGQHNAITGTENPIAFSRFVDKVATIPGRGKTKTMHVVELQSDLFDDIIKKGSKTGSKEKDFAEVADLEKKAFQIEHSGPFQREAVDKLKSISVKQYSTPAEKSEAIKEVLDRYPDIKTQLIDYIKVSDRSEKLKARATVGDYGMDEAFAGMEKSPQVLQQLMIKNTIGAAMQRGVNAITFPGKESQQSQLYEKLGPNLKQVVKDLGKGFEIRPIELYDDFGKAYMHQGIVWDNDTAARVLKEGIKFNQGGAVDKNNLDYAKYI